MAIVFPEGKNRFNTPKIILVFFVVILIAGLAWFYRVQIVDVINRVPSEQIIAFPDVKNRTIIQKDFENNSLALEMSRFIVGEAKEKTLWKLEYADVDLAHTIGFEITYKLSRSDRNLKEFYEEQLFIAKNNGWNLLAKNMEGTQAFLEIERKNPSASYKVRIYAEEKDNYLDIKFQYLIIRD